MLTFASLFQMEQKPLKLLVQHTSITKKEKYDYTLMEFAQPIYNSADKFKTEEDYKAENY